jgi:hypothetical protein
LLAGLKPIAYRAARRKAGKRDDGEARERSGTQTGDRGVKLRGMECASMIALSMQEALAHSKLSASAHTINPLVYLHHFDIDT